MLYIYIYIYIYIFAVSGQFNADTICVVQRTV